MPIFIADALYIRPRQRISLSVSITERAEVLVALDAANHLSPSATISSVYRVSVTPTLGLSLYAAIIARDSITAVADIIGAGTYVLHIASTDHVAGLLTIGDSISASIADRTQVASSATVSSAGSISLSSAITTTDRVASNVSIVSSLDDILRFQVFDLDFLQAINPRYVEEFI